MIQVGQSRGDLLGSRLLGPHGARVRGRQGQRHGVETWQGHFEVEANGLLSGLDSVLGIGYESQGEVELVAHQEFVRGLRGK